MKTDDYLFLVPLYIYDDTQSHIGIGLYHPDEEEFKIMTELQECLSKGSAFKEITQEMIVPPLVIKTFHERPFYSEWLLGLSLAFGVLLLIGCAIEIFKFCLIKKRMKSKPFDKALTVPQEVIQLV